MAGSRRGRWRTDGAIRRHRPWTEPSAHTGHRRRGLGQQAVVDLRRAHRRSPHCQNRGRHMGRCGGGQRRLVLLTLTVVVLALRRRVRDEAMHLIAEGHEAPDHGRRAPAPTPVSPRTRDTLARTLEMMLRQALRPPRITTRGARPVFSVLVIASVAPDLCALISVLRTKTLAPGCGSARAAITHGDSPLYGREAAVLREELRRVRSALGE